MSGDNDFRKKKLICGGEEASVWHGPRFAPWAEIRSRRATCNEVDVHRIYAAYVIYAADTEKWFVITLGLTLPFLGGLAG